MPEMGSLMRAGLAAGAVAAVVLLVIAWPWRHPAPTRRAIGWTLSVGLGFYAGCAALELWPTWPPSDDRGRFLTLIVPAAILVELICAFLPGWWVWLPRLLVAGAVAPTLLYDTVYLEDKAGPGTREWPTSTAILILAGLGAALFVAWILLDRLQARTSDRSSGAALALTSAVAGVAVMVWGYATGGQLGVPLAGALAGATVASLLVPAPYPPARFSGVGLVALAGIIFMGRYFGSLSDIYAACLFAAPLVAWIGEAPRFVVRLLFVILLLTPLSVELAKEIKKELAGPVEEVAPQPER